MATSLLGLIQDPPPDYVFELSEGGIAYTRPDTPSTRGSNCWSRDYRAISCRR